MRYLSQGQEDRRIIAELIGLTKLGENMKIAVVDHLVRGFSIAHAAMLNDVKAGNLSVAIKDLNKKMAVVENILIIKTYDQCHMKLTGK